MDRRCLFVWWSGVDDYPMARITYLVVIDVFLGVNGDQPFSVCKPPWEENAYGEGPRGIRTLDMRIVLMFCSASLRCRGAGIGGDPM